MPEKDTPEVEHAEAEQQSMSALLGELVQDTSTFARAEFAYFRAEAGERFDYAIPGLLLILCAAALGMGTLVALLTGLVLWLSPIIGTGLAAIGVSALGGLSAVIAAKIGISRLRGSLKKRNER
jgi:Putative Actinobacterial Holin-X, holin superfamily III